MSGLPPEGHHVERIAGASDLPRFPDHLARYRFALQWAPAARILDVCCGSGYGAFLLAAAGARRVVGLDISDEAIDAARRQPLLPNLSFRVADARHPYPEAGSWNLITCFEGVEHVAEPSALLERIYEALRPGGVAIISTPNASGYQGGSSHNPYHLAEMPEERFREIIERFSWQIEWYAQISKSSIWTRAGWQRAAIRALPKTFRRWRQERAKKKNPPTVWQNYPVEELWRQDSDDWYPIPWKTAVRIMYNPPPHIILAVCRRRPMGL